MKYALTLFLFLAIGCGSEKAPPPPAPKLGYLVIEQKDTSHAGAKRATIRVMYQATEKQPENDMRDTSLKV